MSTSRTRRTASALWRCAGQPITDNDPGAKSIACAIAHAAVVVLPTCRAVKAKIEAPRGARRNVSCHAVGVMPKTWRTHSTGSIWYATSRRRFIVHLHEAPSDLRFDVGSVVERLDQALGNT